MTPTDPHTAIDERGRRAATALHDLLEAEGAAGGIDAESDIDDDVVAFRPRRSPMPYLLAAAAAVVVVVGLVVLSTGDDASPVASNPSTYLLPGSLPGGLEAIGGTDDLGAPVDGGAFVVEGDGAIYAADPTMQPPTLAVLVVRGENLTADGEGESVVVQGSDAILSIEGEPGIGGTGVTVRWTAPEGLVIVTGVDLTREQTLAAAEAVEFDGDRPTVPANALPDGFSLQHRDGVNALIPFGTAYALDGGGAAVIAYSDADQTSTIIMSTGPGDQRRVDAIRPFLTDPRTVEVRGTDGIVGAPFPDSLTLTWLEGDHTVARLLAFGDVTEADLLAMAQSLVPATAADFSRAVADATEAGQAASTPAEADLTVEVEGGTLFVVIDEANDSIEVGIQSPSGGSSSGTSLRDFASDGTMVSIEEDQVFGLLGGDIARVEIVDAGVTTQLELIPVPGHPFRAFSLDGTTSQAEVRVFDALGNVIQSG